MNNQQPNKEEEKYIKNQQYISLAIIAGAFAILTTFLQINETNLDNFNLKSAVLFLSIAIAYLSFDAFFLNMEEPDGDFEARLLAKIRIFFWFIGGIGICLAFGYLPNISNFSTALVIGVFFGFRLLVMFIAKYKGIKKKRK